MLPRIDKLAREAGRLLGVVVSRAALVRAALAPWIDKVERLSVMAVVEEVRQAGERAAEPGWPMPVWDDYKEQIRSDVADVKNTGGRAAGSITAALFLQEFVDGFPWVHLDIAGTAYSQTDLGWIPKGPTGVPVGTFVEFVRGRAG